MESKKQKTYDNKGSLYRFSDGFTWKIVSKKEAKVLFNKNQEVFGLNTDEETEGVIEELSDLEAYEVFAVEYKAHKTTGKTNSEGYFKIKGEDITNIPCVGKIVKIDGLEYDK